MDHNTDLNWRKSSYSGGSATSENCVEVAATHPGHVAIRDSKNPNGPILKFPATDWASFINGIRAGKYA
jgi:Domain of unknown function (DUF397).